MPFLGHFSALSGGVALGIMMIPTVCRSTEEMLLMVPHAVREAALGLGVPNWRSVLSITVKTASPGIITGCMLAFARVAGETAPLLFTALGNQFWSTSLNQPIAALPLQIYIYANSPYEDQHRMAWAGALVLHCADRARRFAGALRYQPRRFERQQLSGQRASRWQQVCVASFPRGIANARIRAANKKEKSARGRRH